VRLCGGGHGVQLGGQGPGVRLGDGGHGCITLWDGGEVEYWIFKTDGGDTILLVGVKVGVLKTDVVRLELFKIKV
jgi:hypothetical protein